MDDIAELLPNATTRRRMQKRAILLCPGDVPRQIYMVRSGCVKVYRLGSEGEEQIAGFKAAGDIFPECWAFGHTSNTMYYYEVIEEGELVSIEREAFSGLLDTQPDIKRELFDYMVKNYTGLMVQVSALEQSHASGKLIMILYYLMVRHSIETKQGEFLVKMKLRHSTLAGMTGLTRETITVELGRLRKLGVVKYTLKRFMIYQAALKKLIGDDAFSEIQID